MALLIAPRIARAANDNKYSSEAKLRKYLTLFDPYVPPVDSVSDSAKLVVNITIKPQDIFGLSMDEHQDLWMDLLLCLSWNSSAYTWEPADFGNPFQISGKAHWLTWLVPFNRLQWNGLTEWCPQVRFMLQCKRLGSGFDAFPADELKCETDISNVDTFYGVEPITAGNVTYSRKDFRRMGDLFGKSGFYLEYMQTETTGEHNRLVVGVRRSASQWLFQMTVPVVMVSLLCLINLWLEATPQKHRDSSRLTTTLALIIIALVQIQMYSPSLSHCSRLPFILLVLAHLVCGQLVFFASYILIIRIDSCEKTRFLYQRAQQVGDVM
ncbi:acetylcholine receptor subunit alpha-type acr-16-like [Tropilaelaps mercedesae]|uniref:Acetylcholine receptor subunit alpha-type acr-16-like n=1 Tax=Tropilaelaps mercedesae TaxID=418985 RepID=A0A1V9XDQ9_9ACAR|nr:acetylcholine receptor subunit alpha-type acr-16-like [Tropilaelaps mercedesae]